MRHMKPSCKKKSFLPTEEGKGEIRAANGVHDEAERMGFWKNRALECPVVRGKEAFGERALALALRRALLTPARDGVRVPPAEHGFLFFAEVEGGTHGGPGF